MPDVNKFSKLREVNYTVKPCCGLCIHGRFENSGRGPDGNSWGTCALHAYAHLKHTGPARGVSIHVFGSCQDVKIKESSVLGAHTEFLQG